jgi:polysulfide reductase chain C
MTLPWGLFIASYLFLGGAAGGTFIVGGIQDLRGKGRKVAGFAGFVSVAAIAFGLLFLILDLGHPEIAFYAFNEPTVSVMAFGTWIISSFAIVSVVYTSFFFKQFPWSKSVGGRKVFAVLGILLGLITMYYTGVLLGVNVSRPLWNQALIPILFTVSGASTGIALVEVAPKLISRRNHSELEEETRGLESADMLLIGAETFIVFSLLYVLLNSTMAASRAASTWLTGSLSLEFWAGFIIAGLAVPLLVYAGALTVWKRSTTASALATTVAGVLVLVGGFVLRYIVLGAGTTNDFLQGLGFVTQAAVSFGPTTTELMYTTGLFAALAVVYAVGAYVMLRPEVSRQAAATAPK